MAITIRKVINATSGPVVLFDHSGGGDNGWVGWAQGPNSDSEPNWTVRGYSLVFGILTPFGVAFLEDDGAFKLLCHRAVSGFDPKKDYYSSTTLLSEWHGQQCIADLTVGADGSIAAVAR